MTIVDDILEHHGVKGMHWGVRKDRASRDSPDVTISTNPSKNNKVKATGGKGHDIHPDAAAAITSRQKARASGTHTLSNAELKKLVERMNLEQNYSRMATQKTTLDRGHENVKKILGVGNTLQQAHAFVNSPAGKVLKSALK